MHDDMAMFVGLYCGHSLPSFQILEVKQEIEKVQSGSSMPAAQQKLIHQGRVLVDDKKFSEYNIGADDFIVVMISVRTSPALALATRKLLHYFYYFCYY